MTSAYLAIVGPTASGKTELALKLAKEQNAEIISVDSRQVYKYLSIGTAKPQETAGIPYHLIDFLEPDRSFSAADFVHLATEKMNEIRIRGKAPIFVGGTGLYFKALTEGLALLPPANSTVRNRLKQEADEKGRAGLHARLTKVDPEAAAKIPANNIQRTIRALEVYEVTGKPISAWHREHQKAGLPLKFMGIDPGREELHRRIEARCRLMLSGGMIEETQTLLSQGFSETCPALSGLGYPRVIAFIKGKLSKEKCLELLIQDTRQYAKRQRTWFRHQLPVIWEER
jgi:tRNA dimethylallyltransferase